MAVVQCKKCKKLVPAGRIDCSNCGHSFFHSSVEKSVAAQAPNDRNESANNYPIFNPAPVSNPIMGVLKVVLLIFTCALFIFIWNIESSKPVYKPSAADLEDAKILKEKQDKEAFYKYLGKENQKEIDRRLYGTK